MIVFAQRGLPSRSRAARTAEPNRTYTRSPSQAGVGSGVATAQVLQQPGPRLDSRIPKLLAILRGVTDDVMLRIALQVSSLWPIGSGDDDAALGDDGTRLILILTSGVRTRGRGDFRRTLSSLRPAPGADAARQDRNQSSPIVSKGRVIVTASYSPKGADLQGYPEHHVVCYSAKDGKQLWDTTVEPGPWLLKDLRGGYTAEELQLVTANGCTSCSAPPSWPPSTSTGNSSGPKRSLLMTTTSPSGTVPSFTMAWAV